MRTNKNGLKNLDNEGQEEKPEMIGSVICCSDREYMVSKCCVQRAGESMVGREEREGQSGLAGASSHPEFRSHHVESLPRKRDWKPCREKSAMSDQPHPDNPVAQTQAGG